MSKGFINISTSSCGDVSYYLREGECLAYYHSGSAGAKSSVLEHWERMGKDEKEGNKSLGIRGRHDAQVRKNYTLSMPNSLSAEACLERVRGMVAQTPIKDCTYTIAVHKGEKDGIVNRHVHLLVNERNLQTMKKDRQMISKAFLEQTFRPLYEKSFAVEFSQGKDLHPRERIEVGLYSADRSRARRGISAYQEKEDFYQRQATERERFVARKEQEQEQRKERIEQITQVMQAERTKEESVPSSRQRAIAAVAFLMEHEAEFRKARQELEQQKLAQQALEQQKALEKEQEAAKLAVESSTKDISNQIKRSMGRGL